MGRRRNYNDGIELQQSIDLEQNPVRDYHTNKIESIVSFFCQEQVNLTMGGFFGFQIRRGALKPEG